MDTIRDLFARHVLRCTRQRMAVYDALRMAKTHPTAEELFRLSQPLVSGLSRATVYNTLEALCKAGLARRLPTTSGVCRYDADLCDHLHLRCRDTSEIRDVPADLGDELLSRLPREVIAAIEQRMGVRIDGVSIQLLGHSNGRG